MIEPEAASDEDRAAWHRHFAVSAFNRSWDLLDVEDRDGDGDAELLAVAFASRWHWGHAGTGENLALGEHQIAKVAAALGLGELSLRFARRALAFAESEAWNDWKLAAAYEGMARACDAAGEITERDEWLSRTRAALDEIDDAEDREVVESQLREIAGYE